MNTLATGQNEGSADTGFGSRELIVWLEQFVFVNDGLLLSHIHPLSSLFSQMLWPLQIARTKSERIYCYVLAAFLIFGFR
jgi:hypothetical protein